MTYRWNYSPLSNHKKNVIEELSEKINIDPVLAELLVNRGLESEQEARRFLYPQMSHLHDPFSLPDMDKAIQRIEKAIGNKQRILVYGDYDVDGTTAVALVYKFFRGLTGNIDYYIPDRYDEGYGISYQGIDYAYETGVKLIISLDCGIKAVEKVEYAKEKGIDFIICDHHVPDDKLPDAVAVVDAKREDSVYPFRELSGCGVGFKLVEAFSYRNGLPFSNIEPLLDLVAVSIASDIVPIVDENRVMAHFGLKQINSNPSFGLRGIIEVCGLQRQKITIDDIVFKIGPRINASGRMVNGKEAVDLMLTQDFDTALEKSRHIDEYNEVRRELDRKATDEAIEYIESELDLDNLKSLVLYKEDWHKGIVGIVASRLTEKYYRPAIVLTKSAGDLITGSARSVPGFDIYSAIESCRDLLVNFGGHTYAAGLTLRQENLKEFIRRFNLFSIDEVKPKMMTPQINVDAEIKFSDITSEMIRGLSLFAPFGPENEKPLFLTRNVRDTGRSKLVGKKRQHIKMDLTDGTTSSALSGIIFNRKKDFKRFKEGKPVDICYTLDAHKRANRDYVQLIVKDLMW